MPAFRHLAALCALAYLVLASAWLSGCEKRDQDRVVTVQSPVKINEQAIDDQVQDAKTKLAEQRRAFDAQSREKLAALDQKIEALKARAADGTQQAKQKAGHALAELERERAEARAALERAQSASEQQWDALKSRASQALGRVEGAYNAAIERLKTD
jgi:hypothetical protein